MRLIGMLDSPYVRRVAVSMKLMGIPFEHEPVSVFRHYDQFAGINPVVKAPTLVTDEGVVLMESTLILEYLEFLAPRDRRLTPANGEELAKAQRLIGLALAACEKTVQIVYETTLRPIDKQHEPWIDRVRGQLAAAYGLLEDEVRAGADWLLGTRPLQADVTVAVAWRFTHFVIPGVIEPGAHPKLAALSQRAEALSEFSSTPLD